MTQTQIIQEHKDRQARQASKGFTRPQVLAIGDAITYGTQNENVLDCDVIANAITALQKADTPAKAREEIAYLKASLDYREGPNTYNDTVFERILAVFPE